LQAYTFAKIGDMDVGDIKLPDVLRCLESGWQDKTVTLDRVRTRIEAVLDWATVRGHRSGDNPARWKGHLDQVLPPPRRIAPVQHFAALPYAELPAFVAALREQESLAARALEFTILTAARSGEALGATWSEIDFANATWIIPASRMKGKREHRVPLSPPAIALLHELPREDGNDFVFIGPRSRRGLGSIALHRVMARMQRQETVHGFRSCFSDWAHECTAHSNHTIEISLAHKVGNEVERSYRRGPMLAKRVKLMADWGTYVTTPAVIGGATVVPINEARQ
jgi:integrase